MLQQDQEAVPQESAPQGAVPPDSAAQAATPQGTVPTEAVPQDATPQEPAAAAVESWLQESTDQLRVTIHDWIVSVTGWEASTAAIVSNIGLMLMMLVLVGVVALVLRPTFAKLIQAFSGKTKTKFDDCLVEAKVPERAAWLAAMLSMLFLPPLLFDGFPVLKDWSFRSIEAISIILGARTLSAFAEGIYAYYHFKNENKIRTRWIVQLINVAIYIPAILMVVGVMGRVEVSFILGSIGALMAALMFIFRDTLTGAFTAVMICVKRPFAVGDWVTFEGANVSGTVQDIGISLILVEKFDGTIGSVPTKDVFSQVVTNHMTFSKIGGRRIVREVLIDASSVRRLSLEEIDELERVPLIQEYISKRQESIEAANEEAGALEDFPLTGRQQTNLAVFRIYVRMYLLQHQEINNQRTLMVRTVQDRPEGIPVQIYCWSTHPGWVKHEQVQDDVMDRIRVVAKDFGLRLVQTPTTQDLASHTSAQTELESFLSAQ